MKEKAPGADGEVSQEGDQKYRVVPILYAVLDPFCGQGHEQQVGEGVDDFGRVSGGIVILHSKSEPVCLMRSIAVDGNTSSHQSKVAVTGNQ